MMPAALVGGCPRLAPCSRAQHAQRGAMVSRAQVVSIAPPQRRQAWREGAKELRLSLQRGRPPVELRPRPGCPGRGMRVAAAPTRLSRGATGTGCWCRPRRAQPMARRGGAARTRGRSRTGRSHSSPRTHAGRRWPPRPDSPAPWPPTPSGGGRPRPPCSRRVTAVPSWTGARAALAGHPGDPAAQAAGRGHDIAARRPEPPPPRAGSGTAWTAARSRNSTCSPCAAASSSQARNSSTWCGWSASDRVPVSCRASSRSPARTASIATSRRPARSRSPTSRYQVDEFRAWVDEAAEHGETSEFLDRDGGPGRDPLAALARGARTGRRAATSSSTRPRCAAGSPGSRANGVCASTKDARSRGLERRAGGVLVRHRHRGTTVRADQVVVATSAYSGWLRRLVDALRAGLRLRPRVRAARPPTSAGHRLGAAPGPVGRQQPVPLLPAHGRRPDPVGRLRRRSTTPAAGSGRSSTGGRPRSRSSRRSSSGLPPARGPALPVPLGRRDRHDLAVHGHLRPDHGRPGDLRARLHRAWRRRQPLGGGRRARPPAATRTRTASGCGSWRSPPIPIPPEPIRSIAVDTVRRELDRADRDEGRRSAPAAHARRAGDRLRLLAVPAVLRRAEEVQRDVRLVADHDAVVARADVEQVAWSHLELGPVGHDHAVPPGHHQPDMGDRAEVLAEGLAHVLGPAPARRRTRPGRR